MSQPLFETQRTRVLKSYEANKTPYIANTKPYRSTASIEFEVYGPYGLAGSETVAFAVARETQVSWFGTEVGGNIATANFNRKATSADTNQTSAHETNAEDVVIEGFNASITAIRPVVDTAVATNVPDGALDAMVKKLYAGGILKDPASSTLNPQIGSPFNLHDVWREAIFGRMALELKFGDNRTEKLGNLADMPDGAGRAPLWAGGTPDRNNCYPIPEGYLWRKRGGETDSKMALTGTLVEPVGILLNLVGQPGKATAFPRQKPTRIIVDIELRTRSLALKTPSQN